MSKITNDELSITLKACRQPGDETIVIEYENGCRQVIRPSKAWNGSFRNVADGITQGTPYRIIHED